MEDRFISRYLTSRAICAKVYFDWLKKNGIIELLLMPYTIPSIFYQKKWDPNNQELIDDIFRFLSAFSILREAGGTYHLTENYGREVANIESLINGDIKADPSWNFITHGLKILDERLDGDSGYWDLKQHSYLFERGLTQVLFRETFITIENNLVRDKSLQIHKTNHLCIYANQIETILPLIDKFKDNFKDITIILPNTIKKEEAISFCEISREHSIYSSSIYSKRGFQQINMKFDLIFIPNGLGFYEEFKDQIKFIKSICSPKALVYGYAPTDAMYQIGIEPIFRLHPQYKGLPNTNDFNRIVKSNGFTHPKRLDPKELIFMVQVE